MECVRKCYARPRRYRDANYASDSSVGLHATDNESSTELENAAEFQLVGERSASTLQVSNEKEAISVSNQAIHEATKSDKATLINICSQCALSERKVNELRALLMKQRREHSLAVKQSKSKDSKSAERYKRTKRLQQQLAMKYATQRQYIENMEREMKRLSANHLATLQQKHRTERERDELKANCLNLQLELNSNQQTLHKLKSSNEKLRTKVFLTEELWRKRTLRLLKKLDDAQQPNGSASINEQTTHPRTPSLSGLPPSKSMKEIQAINTGNTDQVWVHFEENEKNDNFSANPRTSRMRSMSAPHAGNEPSDDGTSTDGEADGGHSVLTMTAIDEHSEQLNSMQAEQRRYKQLGNVPRFVHQASNQSASTYREYDDDDDDMREDDEEEEDGSVHSEPQFVARSNSDRFADAVMWKHQNSADSYQSYAHFKAYHNENNMNSITSQQFGQTRDLSFYDKSKHGTGAETPISPLTSIGAHSRYDSLFDMVDSAKSMKSVFPGIDGVYGAYNEEEMHADELKAQSESGEHMKMALISMANESENDEKEKDENGEGLALQRRHSVGTPKPVDLKRTQYVNKKMQTVSLENTALKMKNERLKNEIKELSRRLSTKSNHDKARAK